MRFLAIVASLLALACAAPAQQAPGVAGGTDVAARIGDRTITVGELDLRWRATDPAEQAQAIQQLYEGRRQALESIVADALIEQASKASGTDQDKYVEAEVARRIKPVTEAQVAEFYKENQGQMQGRDLPAMGPAIRRYLEEQERASAYRALVADLKKAAPRIDYVLDAPRYDVAVEADDPSLGSASALVTLVEFSDFQCPFCARVRPTLMRVKETYGDRVRIVWKDFPLTSIHPQAFKAAEAGQCAQEQGKFWEYHDRLFTNQQALQPESLKKYAADMGLDAGAFNACLDSGKHAERVKSQVDAGTELGVSSTPSVFINGRMLSGAQPFEAFASVIDDELARAR